MTTRLELTERQNRLHARLVAIRGDIQRKKGPVEADFEEQATQRENDEVLDELEVATRRELEQVNAAIERMDSGVYGICLQCEESINERRLAAMPSAVLCVRCASERERTA